MASIQKRGCKYIVRWRDGSARQYTRTCPDHRTAKILQREVETALALGRNWEPARPRQEADITTIAAEFLASRAHRLRPATLANYGGMLDSFIAYLQSIHGPALPISLLSKKTLESYHEWLCSTPANRGQMRTPSTIRKMVETVHTLWVWAESSEKWPEIRRPRKVEVVKLPAKAVVAPTWGEMALVVHHCDGWQRQLTTVLYYCGLRCGETLLLRWSDVDLERGTLTIRPEISKTNHGRVIPVHDHLWQLWRDSDLWHVPNDTNDWLIASPYKTRRPKTSRLDDEWTRAGVPKHVWSQSPHHAFRRGFKSGLLSMGAPSDAVDYLQGHTLHGARARYIDPFIAFDLRSIANMVPTLELSRL